MEDQNWFNKNLNCLVMVFSRIFMCCTRWYRNVSASTTNKQKSHYFLVGTYSKVYTESPQMINRLMTNFRFSYSITIPQTTFIIIVFTHFVFITASIFKLIITYKQEP